MGLQKDVEVFELYEQGRDTVLRDLKEKTSVCKPVFQDLIFEKVRKMYQDLMTEHNIKSALVEIAEDETSLVRHLTYCQKSDLIIGSCEPESPDHQCLEYYVHKVGDNEGAYNALVNFFSKSLLSSMARVIIFNPLHINLPTLVN